MQNKIVFLGGGNIAEAIFSQLLIANYTNIEVIQHNFQKRQALEAKYPIKIFSKISANLSSEEILILAVKPQDAKKACTEIKAHIKDCVIVSVMAGINIATIKKWTGNSRTIRVITNTPAKVKQAITGIYGDSKLKSELTLCQNIFAKFGSNYLFDTEDKIDKMIPIGSSSIAYVYYFMEAMIESAMNNFKFDEITATQIIKEVFSGTQKLIAANPDFSLKQLREQVTSKKGTTEQAINTFEKNNLKKIIDEAMQNCYIRSLEISKSFE